mmetsp:Transcript_20394/g.78369  ORF Transcript_20394/g.78369 Transcript_20394/m.78369 type:complete len:203 (+) Transcript_20394:682-1290(+)
MKRSTTLRWTRSPKTLARTLACRSKSSCGLMLAASAAVADAWPTAGLASMSLVMADRTWLDTESRQPRDCFSTYPASVRCTSPALSIDSIVEPTMSVTARVSSETSVGQRSGQWSISEAAGANDLLASVASSMSASTSCFISLTRSANASRARSSRHGASASCLFSTENRPSFSMSATDSASFRARVWSLAESLLAACSMTC